MRNIDCLGKGLRVGEMRGGEDIHTNLPCIHVHLYKSVILFPSLHIYRASIYKPYPTYTYIFAALYTHDTFFLVTFPYLD